MTIKSPSPPTHPEMTGHFWSKSGNRLQPPLRFVHMHCRCKYSIVSHAWDGKQKEKEHQIYTKKEEEHSKSFPVVVGTPFPFPTWTSTLRDRHQQPTVGMFGQEYSGAARPGVNMVIVRVEQAWLQHRCAEGGGGGVEQKCLSRAGMIVI